MAELDVSTGGLRLSEVRRRLKEEGQEAFAHRYGSAFLVHYVSGGDLPGFAQLNQTVSLEQPAPTPTPMTKDGMIVLFPVRPSGRSPWPDHISVGRALNNDIVLRESSLSKCHAYFGRTDDGCYTLLDAGSQNGTFVDEVRVPTKGRGEPMTVPAGAQVRFGGVRCNFVLLAELQALAGALAFRAC